MQWLVGSAGIKAKRGFASARMCTVVPREGVVTYMLCVVVFVTGIKNFDLQELCLIT